MELKSDWKKDVVAEPWRKHLTDAADLIRKHGHVKGAFRGRDGEYCTIGAIVHAATGTVVHAPWGAPPVDMQAIEAAQRFAKTVTGSEYVGSICDWNNTRVRTASDVIAALEACARM